MSERMPHGSEKLTPKYEQPTSPESNAEKKEIAFENLEQKKHDALEAKQEALEAAKHVERPKDEQEHPERHKEPVTRARRDKSFDDTMSYVRSDMSLPSQMFSTFIHHPVVERVSEVAGNTIARPNAILGGAICALIFTIALYWLASYVGFALSGFETIGAFALGWLLGILYDLVKSLFKRKH